MSGLCGDNMNDQQRATRVFVIGTAVESVQDLRLLSGDRVVRRALEDAGIEDEQLVRAVCVGECGAHILNRTSFYRRLFLPTKDRAMQGTSLLSNVPTFEVQNATLNSGKTLLLGRQLIAAGGAGCVLALGLDRHPAFAARPVRVQASVDARPLIVEFGRVQRRNVADALAEEEVWQQTEQFQENWCHGDVIVACVLANEATVQRLRLHERAMEICDMELAFAEEHRRSAIATERVSDLVFHEAQIIDC